MPVYYLPLILFSITIYGAAHIRACTRRVYYYICVNGESIIIGYIHRIIILRAIVIFCVPFVWCYSFTTSARSVRFVLYRSTDLNRDKYAGETFAAWSVETTTILSPTSVNFTPNEIGRFARRCIIH